MTDLSHELKLVRAAVYLCRLAHEKPSASKVTAAIKAVSGKGMRKGDVCRLMKQLFAIEGDTSGNRSGTEAELSGNHSPGNREPLLSTTGTDSQSYGNFSGTSPEHHARNRNVKLEIKKEIVVSQQPELKLEHEAVKPKKPQRGPSEDDLRAFAIRDLLAKHIEPMLNGMTIVAWKKANVRACSDLAKAGKTPEQVLAYWQSHTASDGRPFAVVSYLQQHMARNGMPQTATPKPAARGAPAERYVPKNLRVDDDIFAQLDRIGRQNALPTRQ